MGCLRVEKDLDGKALLIFAFEVTTTPTIQLAHHCPCTRSFPTNKVRDDLVRVASVASGKTPIIVWKTHFFLSHMLYPAQVTGSLYLMERDYS
jgi:hypothetical protein